MVSFYILGEETSNREIGDTDMDGQNDKTRPPPLETEEWDGPSKCPEHKT